MEHKPLYKRLYVQVLFAIVVGVILGAYAPETRAAMKPLGDGFIKLIKMIIAPIIFATVVVGIAKMGDMKEVGRVGVKALFYFEVVTTLALVIGLVVVNVLQPGAGMNVDPSTLDTKDIAKYTAAAKNQRPPTSCSTSFRTLSSTLSPKAKSSRCCWSRSSTSCRTACSASSA